MEFRFAGKPPTAHSPQAQKFDEKRRKLIGFAIKSVPVLAAGALAERFLWMRTATLVLDREAIVGERLFVDEKSGKEVRLLRCVDTEGEGRGFDVEVEKGMFVGAGRKGVLVGVEGEPKSRFFVYERQTMTVNIEGTEYSVFCYKTDGKEPAGLLVRKWP